MHKLAVIYITEIKKQRQRLRNSMPDQNFETWRAKTLAIIEYIPEIGPLKQRFIDVGGSNDSVDAKVQQARTILTSIIEIIESPLFGTGKSVAIPLAGGSPFVFSPNMIQNLTQSINVDLDTLTKRVDAIPSLSVEKKAEAKSLVGKIWEHIMSGTKDAVPLIDLIARLASLGVDVQQILGGLH